MIYPNDKEIKWYKGADEEMTLETMVNSLLKYKGDSNYVFSTIYKQSAKSLKQAPCLPEPDIRYQMLYKKHSTLLDKIVKIFNGGNEMFRPSEITKPNTNEYYIMQMVNIIMEIEWFNCIEEGECLKGLKNIKGLKSLKKGRTKNYKDLHDKLDDFHLFFNVFGNSKEYKFEDLFFYPRQRNDILSILEEDTRNHNRQRQFAKAITITKEHFGIERLKISNHEKINRLNRDSNILKQKYKYEKQDGEIVECFFEELPKDMQDKERFKLHKKYFGHYAKSKDEFMKDLEEQREKQNIDKKINTLMEEIKTIIRDADTLHDKKMLPGRFRNLINEFKLK